MMTPEIAAPLATFLLGYLAVLAAPGPNMLAIGRLSALQGFRGVVPFRAGMAAGATVLATSVHLLSTFSLAGGTLQDAGRVLAALLLLAIALRVANTPRPLEERRRLGMSSTWRDDLIALAVGFGTAVTNPITGACFAAQFFGPLAQSPLGPLAMPLVALQALGVSLLVAVVFARPAARRLVQRHFRLACLAAAALLAVLAASLIWPLLR